MIMARGADLMVTPIVVGPRRGLSRAEAAAYVGIGTTLFDRMVADGDLPSGHRLHKRVVWDIRELDLALDQIFEKNAQAAEVSPYSDTAA